MGQNASTPFEYGSSFSPESGTGSVSSSRTGAFYRGRRGARPLSTLSSTSSSYFPSLSKRSSVSSESSLSTAVESPSPSTNTSASRTTGTPSPPGGGMIVGNYPLPPLDREYAKPEGELDVAKQLAKKPAYWSAQGWVHRAAAAGEPRARAEDPETRARKFAEAKRELLASAGRL